jgi:hypothetical protein
LGRESIVLDLVENCALDPNMSRLKMPVHDAAHVYAAIWYHGSIFTDGLHDSPTSLHLIQQEFNGM